MSLVNEQREVRIRVSPLREFLSALRGTLRLGKREYSVCFVNDRKMRQYNRRHRGKDRSTDVLAFPWQDHGNGFPSTGELSKQAGVTGYLGDILISAETARIQAHREGHGLEKEICFLMLHGLLHLVGMDHEKDSGEMVRREHSLRRLLGLCGDGARESGARKRKVLR